MKPSATFLTSCTIHNNPNQPTDKSISENGTWDRCGNAYFCGITYDCDAVKQQIIISYVC